MKKSIRRHWPVCLAAAVSFLLCGCEGLQLFGDGKPDLSKLTFVDYCTGSGGTPDGVSCKCGDETCDTGVLCNVATKQCAVKTVKEEVCHTNDTQTCSDQKVCVCQDGDKLTIQETCPADQEGCAEREMTVCLKKDGDKADDAVMNGIAEKLKAAAPAEEGDAEAEAGDAEADQNPATPKTLNTRIPIKKGSIKTKPTTIKTGMIKRKPGGTRLKGN